MGVKGGYPPGSVWESTNNDQTGAVSTNTPVLKAYNRVVMCVLYFALTQALPFKMEALFTPPRTPRAFISSDRNKGACGSVQHKWLLMEILRGTSTLV